MKIAKISGFLLILINLYSFGMQRPSDIQEKIAAIKGKYQLHQFPAHKVPAACLVQNSQEPNTGLACFVAGYQQVYAAPTRATSSFDNHLQELFSHLNVRHIQVGDDSIFYTPSGQRNALLLAKLKLNDMLARIYKQPALQNPYLLNSLLGYKKADIKNAYIDEAFAHWYTGPALDPLKRQQTRNDFAHNHMWQTTDTYNKYLNDKINAEEWLQEQSDKDIQHLKAQITSLKEQVAQKSTYMQRLRTWWTTAPSSFEWTKW